MRPGLNPRDGRDRRKITRSLPLPVLTSSLNLHTGRAVNDLNAKTN
jgi:hypothetical protein